MAYTDVAFEELLDLIAAETPAPGGGSVAAFVTEMAASLAAMAARFAHDWDGAAGAVAQAETLRHRAAPLADADAMAYENVLTAMRMPKELEPEVRDTLIGRRSRARPTSPSRSPSAPRRGGARRRDRRLRQPEPARRRGRRRHPRRPAARGAANLVEINLATVEGDDRVERAGGLVRSAENAAGARPAKASERDRHRRRAASRTSCGPTSRSRLAELRTRRRRPRLATVLVGDDYAAQAYERRVRRLAEEMGCRYVSEQLAADVEEADALALVGKLNADPRVSGILILRPLPPQVSEEHLYEQLDPLKDVEAVHPENAGLLALGEPRYTPSTPASVFWLLDRYVEESGRDPRRSTTASTSSSWDARTTSASRRSGSASPAGRRSSPATTSPRRPAASRSTRAGRHPRRRRRRSRLVTGDMVKEGVIAVDVGINPVRGRGDRQGSARRRPRLRERRREGRGDHARTGRRRADHRRLAAPQHGRGGALQS